MLLPFGRLLVQQKMFNRMLFHMKKRSVGRRTDEAVNQMTRSLLAENTDAVVLHSAVTVISVKLLICRHQKGQVYKNWAQEMMNNM